MNALVMDATIHISNWTMDFLNKTNRTIHRIGYARAAAELYRLGYYEEAKKCRKLISEFKN